MNPGSDYIWVNLTLTFDLEIYFISAQPDTHMQKFSTRHAADAVQASLYLLDRR